MLFCRLSRCLLIPALLLLLALPAWAEGGPEAKFARVNQFATQGGYARMMGDVAQQMRGVMRKSRAGGPQTLTKDEAVAVMVWTMLRTTMRPGNQASTERQLQRHEKSGKVIRRPSFGASTLRQRHVRTDGNRVRLRFWGKSKVHWDRTVYSPALSRAVALLKGQPGTKVFEKARSKRLFQVPGARGEMVKVTNRDLGAFFANYGALPKDLRTLQANALVLRGLADMDRRKGRPRTQQEAQSRLDAVVLAAAKQLGHSCTDGKTDTIRDNYLQPRLLTDYVTGQTDGRGRWAPKLNAQHEWTQLSESMRRRP